MEGPLEGTEMEGTGRRQLSFLGPAAGPSTLKLGSQTHRKHKPEPPLHHAFIALSTTFFLSRLL